MTAEKTALPSSSPSQLLSQPHLAQTSTYTHTWSCVTAPGQVLRSSRARSGQQAHLESTERQSSAPWAEPTAGAYHSSMLPPAGDATQATALPLPLGDLPERESHFQAKGTGHLWKPWRLAGGPYVPKPGESTGNWLSHTHSCNKTIVKQARHLRTSLFWPRLTFNGRVPSYNFTISPSRESGYPGSKEWPWAYTKRAT